MFQLLIIPISSTRFVLSLVLIHYIIQILPAKHIRLRKIIGNLKKTNIRLINLSFL